jgi:hypothetical protein
VKLVFFTDRSMVCAVDRHLADIYDAALQTPGVEPVVFGPEWEGWDNRTSDWGNLQKLGLTKRDVVLHWGSRSHYSDELLKSCPATLASRQHECREVHPGEGPFCKLAVRKLQVTLFAYPQEMALYVVFMLFPLAQPSASE